MTKYEILVTKATELGAKVIELDLGTNKPCGKCIDDVLIINNRVTEKEKYCILSEELGHFLTSHGDISNLHTLENKKQELIARRYGYELILGPIDIIEAHRFGSTNISEMADYLNITLHTLNEAINCLKMKYGTGCYVGNYYLMLEPKLGVLEDFGMFDYCSL